MTIKKPKVKKVCVVTGTRAEYGLLYWLMKDIYSDADLKLQVIVTGTHLSPEFGLMYREIEKDFLIDKKIEMLLSSDTSIGISKSMGLSQISFAESYEELKPDIIILLGDRYEIFSAASAAMIARIPIAHIHGGETTEGAFDEAIRHSITKMSHLHFATTIEYKNRIIQLGENKEHIYNVGSLGVENIKRLKLHSREEIEKMFCFDFTKKNIIVTFHPVTLENKTSQKQFKNLLDALLELNDVSIVFTKSNADTDSRIINEMIDSFVKKHSDNSCAVFSMGQLNYFSALQYIDLVIGNSSSGIIETPSFRLPTINIGERQKGRVQNKNVINCLPEKDSISEAIDLAFSDMFIESIKNIKNVYEQDKTSKSIIDIIKRTNLSNIIKKRFNDIKN